MKSRSTKHLILVCLFSALILSFAIHNVHNSYAFSGCEEGCEKCHSLSAPEVRIILEKMKAKDAKILKIQMSPVKGLWEVDIENRGQRGLFYVDFSKKFLVSGSIVEVNAAINKTKQRVDELNKDRRINPASIPLKDALILGSSTAPKKVIVFTDPDCPYCFKLHQEMKKVLAQRMDIAFYLKFFPLKGHVDAYWKSKSIVCDKSIKLLEDNFEKKSIPKIDCNTKEIDENIKFAEKNGITGTPTMILPDGSIYSGFTEADNLIKLIDEASLKKGSGKKKKG